MVVILLMLVWRSKALILLMLVWRSKVVILSVAYLAFYGGDSIVVGLAF